MTVPDAPREPAEELPVLSHDRDVAVARAKQVYVDGDISYEDLDALLGRLLTTRSRSVIDAVLAGLPAATEESADAEKEIAATYATIRREGRWRVPRHLRIVSAYGDVRLDLAEASFAAATVEIELHLSYGSARLVLPPDATVDTDDLRTDWWQPRYDQRRRSGSGGATVRVTGRLEYGRLTIKHAARR